MPHIRFMPRRTVLTGKNRMRRALGGSEKDRFSAATVGSNPGGAGKERCLRPGRNSTRADDSGTVDVIEFAVVIVVRVMGTQSAAQIPTSFGKELRACLRCSLVKTYKQFTDVGCENCPFFNMDQDNDRVLDCTTPNFAGVIASMEPTSSWAARWQRISKFVPGCYALSVTGMLPEEMAAICEYNNVRYVPRS